MLRLLTLEDYLKVMTVEEQEHIFRDGQPFTLPDLRRWEIRMKERNESISKVFQRTGYYGRIEKT